MDEINTIHDELIKFILESKHKIIYQIKKEDINNNIIKNTKCMFFGPKTCIPRFEFKIISDELDIKYTIIAFTKNNISEAFELIKTVNEILDLELEIHDMILFNCGNIIDNARQYLSSWAGFLCEIIENDNYDIINSYKKYEKVIKNSKESLQDNIYSYLSAHCPSILEKINLLNDKLEINKNKVLEYRNGKNNIIIDFIENISNNTFDSYVYDFRDRSGLNE